MYIEVSGAYWGSVKGEDIETERMGVCGWMRSWKGFEIYGWGLGVGGLV